MKRKGFTLIELLIVVAVLGLLMALLLPALSSATVAARNAQSQNNLRSIGQALHSHHDIHNEFPTAGSSVGMFVSLLPFLEQKALCDLVLDNQASTGHIIDTALTTTGTGTPIASVVVPTFIHPGFRYDKLPSGKYTFASPQIDSLAVNVTVNYGMLCYRGVRGCLTSGNPIDDRLGGAFGRSMSIDGCVDGLSYSLGVGEAMFNKNNIPEGAVGTFCNDDKGMIRGWIQSHDVGTNLDGRWDTLQFTMDGVNYHPPGTNLDTDGITELDGLPFSNPTKRGAMFVLMDGSTRFIDSEIDATALYSLAIVDDGEVNERSAIQD